MAGLTPAQAGRRSLLAALALSGLPTRLWADQAPIRLGTSTPGGGFAQYGELLAERVNARAGRAVLQARPTRGTTENLALLRSGELDAGLVQGTVASEVLAQGPASGLRILWAMYPSPGMLAVPSASPHRRLEDLRGRRVVFGVRASGLVALGRQVFEGIGLDIDRDLQPVYVEQAADSPRRVLDGQAEALWGAGEGWPGFLQLARAPGGARFLGPQPEQIPDILRRHPLLRAMEVPPGSYPGIEAPLATVGSVNLILARADLDRIRAGALLPLLEAASADLAARLPQAAFGTRANTLASAPQPALLHAALSEPDRPQSAGR